MADYAIQYDGVLLQSACPKAQVVDIVVQPIPIERTSKARATGNGSLLVRSRLLPRTVAISVEFPLDPSGADARVNQYASKTEDILGEDSEEIAVAAASRREGFEFDTIHLRSIW